MAKSMINDIVRDFCLHKICELKTVFSGNDFYKYSAPYFRDYLNAGGNLLTLYKKGVL